MTKHYRYLLTVNFLDKNITPDAESEDEVQIIAVGEKSADLLFKKNKTIEVSICRYCL